MFARGVWHCHKTLRAHTVRPYRNHVAACRGRRPRRPGRCAYIAGGYRIRPYGPHANWRLPGQSWPTRAVQCPTGALIAARPRNAAPYSPFGSPGGELPRKRVRGGSVARICHPATPQSPLVTAPLQGEPFHAPIVLQPGLQIVTALSAVHKQNTKYTLSPRLAYRIYTNIHVFGIILHISVSKELQKPHTYCQCRVVCGIVYVFFPPRTGVRGWKWVSISYMEGNHQ